MDRDTDQPVFSLRISAEHRWTQTAGRQRWGSLAVSLAIHGAAFVAFVNVPAIQLPRAAESEYRQALAGKEDKLVWYKFRELPRVTPPRPKNNRQPLRAAVAAKQAIVSSPKNAPRRRRTVWTPAPELKAAPPLESPNLIAVKLPDPPVRRFVTPPFLTRKQAAKIDVPEAPALLDVRVPPRPLVQPPAARRQAAALPRLAADAPALDAQPTRAVELRPVPLPPKPYIAPPAAKRVQARATLVDEAPQLAASATPGASALHGPAPKLPPRPFAAPQGTKAGVSSVGVAEAAPAPDLPGDAAPLNLATVGLNPLDRPAPLPAASSPAAFSAGPKVRPEGATSEGTAGGLSVPDLFVRGARDAKPDPVGPSSAGQTLISQAHASPTSAETLREAMRRGQPAITPPADPPPADSLPAPARVSSAPDPRFNGRAVYMMAIQMPNLTSYSGSWLMWYAARTRREADIVPISAPVAHRKVDPKYAPAVVAERVEGKVELACVIDQEGKVSGVEVVRGADERLNQAAEDALAKWEFYPATRQGSPVAVDVLVEIPFRLAPPIPYRR
jgi:periplasmic protein TonB